MSRLQTADVMSPLPRLSKSNNISKYSALLLIITLSRYSVSASSAFSVFIIIMFQSSKAILSSCSLSNSCASSATVASSTTMTIAYSRSKLFFFNASAIISSGKSEPSRNSRIVRTRDFRTSGSTSVYFLTLNCSYSSSSSDLDVRIMTAGYPGL